MENKPLEQAAKEYANIVLESKSTYMCKDAFAEGGLIGFIAGANWQAAQPVRNKEEISDGLPVGEGGDVKDELLELYSFWRKAGKLLAEITGIGLRPDVESYEKAWNKIKSDYIPTPQPSPASKGMELFRDDLQVSVDRILRDKGTSSREVFDAINDSLQELSKKYKISSDPTPVNNAVEASKGMVGEEELMEMLNDKRIISVCGVDEGIWHISRKETARYLLEKYNITKADPTPVNNDAVEASKGKPVVHNEDANVYIDRAIAMLKEEYKDEWLIAGYNGIVSLLGYAKESHAASKHQPREESDAVEFAEWIERNEWILENFKGKTMAWNGIEFSSFLSAKIIPVTDLYTLFKQHKQG